jgi:hypothetical protein
MALDCCGRLLECGEGSFDDGSLTTRILVAIETTFFCICARFRTGMGHFGLAWKIVALSERSFLESGFRESSRIRELFCVL